MVNNTGLEQLCIMEDNPNVTKRIIHELMQKEFTPEDIRNRTELLSRNFSNHANALHMASELFS